MHESYQENIASYNCLIMSGSGLNVSCFPSQMSTDSTTMSGCELKLWTINLIVFAGIAFVSILFLSIVLFCRFHKRKSSKLRLVYETKPKSKCEEQEQSVEPVYVIIIEKLIFETPELVQVECLWFHYSTK